MAIALGDLVRTMALPCYSLGRRRGNPQGTAPTVTLRYPKPAGGLAPLALALVACAADPRFPASAVGEPVLARDLLERSAAQGPVPLEVRNPPAALDGQALGEAAAAGVRGLSLRFEPTDAPSPDGYRLVLWFDGPADAVAVCRGETQGRAPILAPALEGAATLAAGWCSGPAPVAGVFGSAGRHDRAALERLVWQTTARLFPDPYPDRYGFELFGYRVRLGYSTGF